MRKATVAQILIVISLFIAASLTTVGLFAAQPLFYVLAVWAFVLALLIFSFFTYRRLQREENRSRQSNELLREIKFLQERRYAQIARRLDSYSRSVPGAAHSRRQPPMNVYFEIENINARIQRAERQIVGQLENHSLDTDQRIRQLEELVSTLRDKGPAA